MFSTGEKKQKNAEMNCAWEQTQRADCRRFSLIDLRRRVPIAPSTSAMSDPGPRVVKRLGKQSYEGLETQAMHKTEKRCLAVETACTEKTSPETRRPARKQMRMKQAPIRIGHQDENDRREPAFRGILKAATEKTMPQGRNEAPPARRGVVFKTEIQSPPRCFPLSRTSRNIFRCTKTSLPVHALCRSSGERRTAWSLLYPNINRSNSTTNEMKMTARSCCDWTCIPPAPKNGVKSKQQKMTNSKTKILKRELTKLDRISKTYTLPLTINKPEYCALVPTVTKVVPMPKRMLSKRAPMEPSESPSKIKQNATEDSSGSADSRRQELVRNLKCKRDLRQGDLRSGTMRSGQSSAIPRLPQVVDKATSHQLKDDQLQDNTETEELKLEPVSSYCRLWVKRHANLQRARYHVRNCRDSERPSRLESAVDRIIEKQALRTSVPSVPSTTRTSHKTKAEGLSKSNFNTAITLLSTGDTAEPKSDDASFEWLFDTLRDPVCNVSFEKGLRAKPLPPRELTSLLTIVGLRRCQVEARQSAQSYASSRGESAKQRRSSHSKAGTHWSCPFVPVPKQLQHSGKLAFFPLHLDPRCASPATCSEEDGEEELENEVRGHSVPLVSSIKDPLHCRLRQSFPARFLISTGKHSN